MFFFKIFKQKEILAVKACGFMYANITIKNLAEFLICCALINSLI